MRSKLFSHNFHLDPAPDGAASGAAPAGSPARGDAAPAFDASQFVPRTELESLRGEYSEFRQTAEQRFQDYDSRLPKPAKVEAKEDKEPDFESGDYDANKPGEIQRYFRDLADYNFKKQFSQRETQYREHQTEQSYRQKVQGAQDSHAERADSFRALNPDYDPNKSILLGNDKVALAVLKSPYSAHIHNYLQKNPSVVSEIRKMAKEDPEDAVLEIGMIAAQFKAQDKPAPTIPAGKPTRAAFGGGAAKPTQRDPLEIVKDWRN